MSEQDTLGKLEAMLNKSYQHGFDDEEIEVLNRVIHIVRGFDALGSLAGFVQKTFVWFGLVVGGIVAFKNGWLDPFLNHLRG